MDEQGLRRDLNALGATLPPGSTFRFDVIDGQLFLELLSVPVADRGGGTQFLARLFAVAGGYGTTSRLDADATDLPGDPTTFELVRWYGRFGCVVEEAGEDRIPMVREPASPASGYEEILRRYEAGRASDLSLDEFEEMRAQSRGRWP